MGANASGQLEAHRQLALNPITRLGSFGQKRAAIGLSPRSSPERQQHRRYRLCDPASGQTPDYCAYVQAVQNRETKCFPLLRLGPSTRASIRSAANRLVALPITLARFHPPRSFTHRPLRENPQLAAPVAVQFQNSEAHLLQSHLEERGELLQNPVAHGRLVVAFLPEVLAFQDQR